MLPPWFGKTADLSTSASGLLTSSVLRQNFVGCLASPPVNAGVGENARLRPTGSCRRRREGPAAPGAAQPRLDVLAHPPVRHAER